MRKPASPHRRWAIDEAASVAIAAAGGILAALLAMVVVVDELAGLVHGQLPMLMH